MGCKCHPRKERNNEVGRFGETEGMSPWEHSIQESSRQCDVDSTGEGGWLEGLSVYDEEWLSVDDYEAWGGAAGSDWNEGEAVAYLAGNDRSRR